MRFSALTKEDSTVVEVLPALRTVLPFLALELSFVFVV